MVEKVTVLGAGTMGHGIVQLYAQAGYDVFMYDIKDEFLEKALTRISHNLDMLIQENAITASEKESILERISISTDLKEAVSGARFITEAVSENLTIKFDLFKQLEEIIEEDTIIASNTSTFSIQQLSEGVQKTDRLIITHFFNPAHLVPLVEVVKSPGTSQDIIDRTVEVLKNIGKKPVVLKKDIPGLIANRLQAALVREAFYLLDNGIADAEDIDLAVTAGPGFRWAFIGPLETADFGGLDIWKSVVENLAPVLSKEEKIPPFVEQKVQSGNLGTKTGNGLFTYAGNEEIQRKITERDENFIRLSNIKNNSK
ncbi:3-hydroxyacyl-CoA dehydrogenase family protein [Psychrobacillus lasiicapitis]|uniref:L-gulonate 3-dehydrogenase n=1 Tax=Psychrobacillus lasiicapitis TaxID=1636719 RepID=A0A544T4N8_9BACI|nr:3-hydroxyacyl-CoA dehydrogenase family protein [Psychrobacillus lasiicapitis]TQR12422.1 3-hydroxyacyl-CoA dehydrogenase family protein [Psychrobacillus lasiicapitis]GGA37973.1 3-hydroxybutyryl-CoA dehydrogenase [Psychrobacillus lasiicapitis]